MNPHAERVAVLLAQNRADRALPEAQQALAIDPDDGERHLDLARCLYLLDRDAEAIAPCEAAIGKLPDRSDAHLLLANCLITLRRLSAARTSLEEARRLDPNDADVHASFARLHIERRAWAAARTAAETGLRCDPEHAQCSNLRAFALTQLGENDLAEDEARATLRRDPENAYAHAQHGWSLLNQNRPRDAVASFREALRLQPGLEFARTGMIEALKAGNPFYALFLRYFLFCGRLGSKAWLLLICLFLAQGFLRSLAADLPHLAWLFNGLYWALFSFAVSTWLVSPLFNAVLMLHPLGRLALQRGEKIQAMVPLGYAAVLVLLSLFVVAGLLPVWSVVFAVASTVILATVVTDPDLKSWARTVAVGLFLTLAYLSSQWVAADLRVHALSRDIDRELAALDRSTLATIVTAAAGNAAVASSSQAAAVPSTAPASAAPSTSRSRTTVPDPRQQLTPSQRQAFLNSLPPHVAALFTEFGAAKAEREGKYLWFRAFLTLSCLIALFALGSSGARN